MIYRIANDDENIERVWPRPTKSKGTRLGSKRDPFKKPKAINPVSEKQAVRNLDLKEKLEVVLCAMHEKWARTFCMGEGYHDHECGGRLDLDHVTPRGRHPEDVDGFGNLQVICRVLHNLKGQTPGLYDYDFRSGTMKAWMKGLKP